MVLTINAPPLLLTISDVRKQYGARRVLTGITKAVPAGMCLAVVGANGSGKSTLLKIVAGLLRPSRGVVTVRVNEVSVADAAERRRIVGYCAPDLSLYPELTGAENLAFFSDVRGEPRAAGEIERRLAAVGLAGRGADPVAAYSSGMRQRLRLAFAARGGNVPVLLLDEPSLALDSDGVALVGEMIAQQKAAGGITLLATNDAREAAWGDERLDVARVA